LLYCDNEKSLGLEMMKDVGNAFGRFQKVNRHDDGAEPQSGKVRNVPLRAVRREKRDAVTLCYSELRKALRKTSDAAEQFLCRDRPPLPVLFVDLSARRRVAIDRFEQAPWQCGVIFLICSALYSRPFSAR